MQELYEEFPDKLSIVGFPCNDFGGQEPGTNEGIQAFCQQPYGVSLPLAAEISIKKPPPIYEWLSKKPLNGVMDTEVRWNFHKFLLNEKGHLQYSCPSTVSPLWMKKSWTGFLWNKILYTISGAASLNN